LGKGGRKPGYGLRGKRVNLVKIRLRNISKRGGERKRNPVVTQVHQPHQALVVNKVKSRCSLVAGKQ